MTRVDVRSLAKLARLEVSDEELKKLEEEIPSILAFVEEIQNVNTGALSVSGGLRNVMREDAPPAGGPHASGIHTEKLLAAALAVKDGRVVVKQVISRKRV